MRKKAAALFLSLMLCLLAGCAKPAPQSYDFAMITDIGTIDDKAFNQGAWEGVLRFAAEAGATYAYFQPGEASIVSYLEMIEQAVEQGAKLIVTPGYMFEVPIYIAQFTYPDITFILVDGVPQAESGVHSSIEKNVVSITFAEEEAGFLAGYAAVKDGFTRLGFIGGMSVPAVVRFGYGYIQGAEYAAGELGLGEGAITLRYHYTGNFSPTPEAQALAASWYHEGTEVIFACGGAVGQSVMAAAESAGAWVIGVDIDQHDQSETVITSAMKGLTHSVYYCMQAYALDKFPGGQHLVMGAASEGVSLAMQTARFRSFSEADYAAIYQKLAAGSIPLLRDVDTNGEQLEIIAISAPCVQLTLS